MSEAPDYITLSALKPFLAVLELGTSTAAAEKLGCATSTVIKRVNALQNWLQRLLLLNDSPLVVTNDGEEFKKIATDVLDIIEKAKYENDLSKIRVYTDGTIKLGGLKTNNDKLWKVAQLMVRARAKTDNLETVKPTILGKDVEFE